MSGYSEWLIQNLLDSPRNERFEKRAALNEYIEELENQEIKAFIKVEDFLADLRYERAKITHKKYSSGYRPK